MLRRPEGPARSEVDGLATSTTRARDGFPVPVSCPPVEDRVRIRWGLGDFVWIWVAMFVMQVVLVSMVAAAHGAKGVFHPDAGDVAILTVGSALFTVFLLWFGVANRGRGSLRTDLGFTVRLADWPWLAVGVLLQLVATAGVNLIQSVAGHAPQQEVARALEHSAVVPTVAGAIAVVVFAPVAEELLFRGLLLRGLLRRVNAGGAVLVCGFVFAAGHLVDPAAAPLLAPLAMVGIVSGVLAVRTGELSRSVLLHAGFNLLSAVLLFVH
jgi:membrane protease YdiL (CAAX protease family)